MKCKYCQREFQGKGPVKARLSHHEKHCMMAIQVSKTPTQIVVEQKITTTKISHSPKIAKNEDNVLISDNSKNNVDQKKFPELHAAVERGLVLARQNRELWIKHYEAMKTGHTIQAEKVYRKIMGIKGPEMSEEAKEKLRLYAQEHKEEIKMKAKLKRMIRNRNKK